MRDNLLILIGKGAFKLPLINWFQNAVFKNQIQSSFQCGAQRHNLMTSTASFQQR